MKRILIGYDFLKELGGLERVMFFQANTLAKNFDVELVFSYVSNKEKNKILDNLGLNKNVQVSQIKNQGNELLQLFLSFVNSKRIIEKEADLIISHSFMCTRHAFEKKKRDGIPYIVMMHHPPNFLYGKSIKWVNNFPRFFAYLAGLTLGPLIKNSDKRAVGGANVILANSKYTARRIKEIYGVNPLVVYPMISEEFRIIDKKDATETLLDILKIEKNYKFALLHGRMIRDKRPDLAVKAFARTGCPNLVISGTIEEEQKLKTLIHSLKIEDRVIIVGKVSKKQLVALYNLAQCFLMTAPGEDFGLTPIEAMACGCPVVAWNDGAGPSETVLSEVNGLLAKPYSVSDFSSKINSVLNKKWNKENISKSVNRFNEKEIDKIFSEIIKQNIN